MSAMGEFLSTMFMLGLILSTGVLIGYMFHDQLNKVLGDQSSGE